MTTARSDIVLLFLTSLALSACADKPKAPYAVSLAPEVACSPSAAKNLDSGAVIVLDQSSDYPCIVVTTPTGVELQHDSAGRWPDPAYPITVDSRGRIFTAQQSVNGVLLFWNADGSFNRAISRQGNGPGELSGWYLNPLRGPDGRLYVRQVGRWTIFSDSLKFVSESKVDLRANRGASFIFDDGRIVSSAPRAAAKSLLFHILQPATGEMISVGQSAGSREDSLMSTNAERSLAYSGGNQFWSAPMMGSGQGYTLELWNSDGQRIRTIRRRVAWFADSADVWGTPTKGKVRSADAMREDRTRGPTEQTVDVRKPPTTIRSIEMDNSGLLWVHIDVVTDRWHHVEDQMERTKLWDGMLDHYIEVIDPMAGIVLASMGPIALTSIIEAVQFPRTNMTYETSQDANGFQRFKFSRLDLKPRTN